MAFFKSLTGRLCLFSLLCSVTLAAPVAEPIDEAELVKRIPGDSPANAIDADFDISNWPNIAEENCYAMLCLLNGNRVYQRVATANAIPSNYRASGAAYVPFQAAQLPSRHTSQINPTTVSAEEFPWKSTQQGGGAAYVFPATTAEQNSQGGTVGGAYSHNNIGYSDWFRIRFIGGPFGEYCTALFSNPPDTSVCTKSSGEILFGTAGVKIANFVYQVVKSGKAPYTFRHAAGPNKGKITKRSEDFEIVVRDDDDEVVSF